MPTRITLSLHDKAVAALEEIQRIMSRETEQPWNRSMAARLAIMVGKRIIGEMYDGSKEKT